MAGKTLLDEMEHLTHRVLGTKEQDDDDEREDEDEEDIRANHRGRDREEERQATTPPMEQPEFLLDPAKLHDSMHTLRQQVMGLQKACKSIEITLKTLVLTIDEKLKIIDGADEVSMVYRKQKHVDMHQFPVPPSAPLWAEPEVLFDDYDEDDNDDEEASIGVSQPTHQRRVSFVSSKDTMYGSSNSSSSSVSKTLPKEQQDFSMFM